MKKLTPNEIEQLTEIKGWKHQENTLQKEFTFSDFKETFSVMTQIAFEAEKQEHHPEWKNVYNKLHISLSTHDVGGITQKDIRLAHSINTIIKKKESN